MEGRSFPAVSRGWPIMEVGMQVELILLQYLKENRKTKMSKRFFFSPIRIFHPINCTVVARYLWLFLFGKI
jgi:hypothetical protein